MSSPPRSSPSDVWVSSPSSPPSLTRRVPYNTRAPPTGAPGARVPSCSIYTNRGSPPTTVHPSPLQSISIYRGRYAPYFRPEDTAAGGGGGAARIKTSAARINNGQLSVRDETGQLHAVNTSRFIGYLLSANALSSVTSAADAAADAAAATSTTAAANTTPTTIARAPARLASSGAR